MEKLTTRKKIQVGFRRLLLVSIFMCSGYCCLAQESAIYTIRDGSMYIELRRNLADRALDSFIRQYDLKGVGLFSLIRKGHTDSIKRSGWKLEFLNAQRAGISKPLFSIDNITNPAEKILITGKEPGADQRFPSISSNIIFGVNRFKNKNDFAVTANGLRFYLRGKQDAKSVYLSGSFNNWSPSALRMSRTDSGWVVDVKLSPGKYWYKFIIDGNWTVDEDNQLRENDGEGNVNSVVFFTNHVFHFSPGFNAKKVVVAGSFNNWNEKAVEMRKSGSEWILPVYLADGTYTYRFIADKKWFIDPLNPDKLPNEFNDFNSVIRLGKQYDFRLPGYESAKKVYMAGSFNGWRKDELLMNKNQTGWDLAYHLGPGNYSYKFFVDGKETTKVNQVMIIDPNYTFHLKGFEKSEKVFLAGDFNQWDPVSLPMKRSGNEWIFTVHLGPGKHLYKFIVDGKWIIDPANPLWEDNGLGTGNSVIWIENK